MTAQVTSQPEYQRPPWAATVAALLAFGALAVSSGACVPLLGLGLGLLTSYLFAARYENVTLTKWTLRIVVIGTAVFSYLLTATKDENSFLDMRWANSFALMAASELTLQFWRREPTGGARAPLTVLLSALVFVVGCSVTDEHHYLWLLAPAFFLCLTLSLPRFRTGAAIPLGLTILPILVALGLGGMAHAGFYTYRNILNNLGTPSSSRRVSASMGMSGQPILGSSFTLRDSLARVLRVQNLGADPYLRGMTFDTYSGRTWNPSLERRDFLPYPVRAFRWAGVQAAHVVRLDDDMILLFAPLHSAAIVPENSYPVSWARIATGPLRTAPGEASALAYDIAPGRGDAPQGLLDAAPTESEKARDLALPPEIDPRVWAVAQKIGQGQKTPTAKIEAVIGFLHRNNHYSLTVNPGPGDPISNFILERKSAHCEYFASSAVILLRALGVPTRYASGYFAHESEGAKGWTLVRQRDAHAWAESWVEGDGWVTVDATPGDGRPDALAGAIPFWWRAWEWVQDALGAIRRWVVNASWWERGGVFGLLVLGLVIPQVYRAYLRRRWVSADFRYTPSDAALAALAGRFEAVMERNGLPCPEERTWGKHLQILDKEDTRRESWIGFVREYGKVRFGNAPGPKEITRLEFALREMEKRPLRPNLGEPEKIVP